MNDCEQNFRPLIEAYFARALAREAAARLLEHVSECAACRGVFENRQRVETIDPKGSAARDRIAAVLGLTEQSAPRATGV